MSATIPSAPVHPAPANLLASALDRFSVADNADDILLALAELAVPAAGDWCLADRLDEPDLVTRVAAVGPAGPVHPVPASGTAPARRSSAATVGVLARLLEAPRRLLRLSRDEVTLMARSAEPRLRAQAQLSLELGVTEVLVLGLCARDQILGVLTVGRTHHPFTGAEVARLVDLALLAGLALDNARLLAAQRSVSAALQRSLLPPLPVVPGLTLAARYVPAGSAVQVGGDWYDVFALPSRELALVIGDATGHDVHATADMAELRHLLRAEALVGSGAPGATLARLDRALEQLGSRASATCLYARLGPVGATGARRLSWASAGHLPPLLIRGAHAGFLETRPELMLGVQPPLRRGAHRCGLLPGDTLLLYTDGLVEDRRASLDTRLAMLKQACREAAAHEPESLADLLIRELSTGDDDVAVLVVRLDNAASGQRPPATELGTKVRAWPMS